MSRISHESRSFCWLIDKFGDLDKAFQEDLHMKRVSLKISLSFFLSLCLLMPIASCAEDEIVYWINPEGGRYYHLDQNCPTVNPRYLPLPVSMTKEELEQPENSFYLPCNVCVSEEYTVPVTEESRETGVPTEKPVREMIIDPQCSEYALTERYVREAPVFLDENNMLAKAARDAEGYTTESRYLQWYRDGKLFREVEHKYREPSRWRYEGIFLSLPDGDVGLAAIEANALNFYRWDEEGLALEKDIPGKWIELYGNTKAICAIKKDDNGTSAHLFDPVGQEVWTYKFDDPTRLAGWQARPTAMEEAGTYLGTIRCGRQPASA